VVIALALTLAALFLATRLEITADNRVFYHGQNPKYAELLRIEETFELYSNVTFLIVSKEGLTKQSSSAIDWLSREVENYEGYIRHHSLANYPHIKSTNDDIEVSTVLRAACQNTSDCEYLDNRTLYPEIEEITNRLISADRTAFAVIVAVDIEVGDNEALENLSEAIKQSTVDFEQKHPDLTLAHTGAIPMMQAFAEASNRDLGQLFPISAGFMLLLSTLLFGSIRFALAVFACSLTNVVWIMGLASLFNLSINSATSTLPLALLVISISSSAHIVCYISFRLNETERTREMFCRLTSQSCNANRTPILLASLTTCIGLATLSFVQIPPFREFGFLAALGTITNYFTVLHLLPAALRLTSPNTQSPSSSTFKEVVNDYARYIDRGKLPTKRITTILVIAVAGLANFSLDEDYIEYFDITHEFRLGANLLSEKLASPYSMEITIEYEEQGEALQAANLKATRDFQSSLTDEELVVNTLSIVQYIDSAKRAFGNSNFSPEDEDEYVQQLYLAFELSLPTGHTTTELVDSEHKRARISLLLGSASSSSLIDLETKIGKLWDSKRHGFTEGAKIAVSGETLPLAHLSKQSIIQVLQSVLVCFALLSVGVLIVTKSYSLAILSVGAIAVPLAMAFGCWAWFDSEFGLATALVIAVTIGILIDDTIHFLTRYRTGLLTHDLQPKSAVSYAVHHSAAGITASSLILVSGFLVLCFSSFAVNQQFGIGVSLTIGSALVLTLIGLPAILLKAEPLLK